MTAKLQDPWLLAVWPGMGQVALTAGYYLMSRLHMRETDPLPATDLFDVDHIDVKDGIVHSGHVPQNHLFLGGTAAEKGRDGILFIGEAQPPLGKFALCGRLLDYAQRRGIREVFTFAALATDMHPAKPSSVVGVATNPEDLEELRHQKVEIMPEGQIGGLNGVLLAAARDRGIRGIGLLGEMPAFAAQVPFPKASHSVLDVFARLTGVSIDLHELEEYGKSMESQLAAVLKKAEQVLQERLQEAAAEAEEQAPDAPPELREEDRRRIESLFEQARRDRSKTFELKRELDRWGLFQEYENRFLDLFKRRGP